MFRCKHENRINVELTFIKTGTICGQKAKVDILQPVYLCRDCRVLFSPAEEETAKIRDTLNN